MSGISVPVASCTHSTCNVTLGVTSLINSTGIFFNAIFGSIEEIRTVTQIVCFYDRAIEIVENVSTIGIPDKPTCDPPQLEDENTYISLTCRTTRIYPQARCLFSVHTMTLVKPGTVIYSHINTTINRIQYYKSECTWKMSLNTFEAGNFTVEMLMFPDVENGTQFGVSTSLPDNFKFTQQIMNLSSECFSTSNRLHVYIIPSAKIYCLCYLETIGYPPGTVRWIDSNSSDVGIQHNITSSILALTGSTGSKTYYCVSNSSLMNSNKTLHYDVNFAGKYTCLFNGVT
ncbi:hypothetical protein Btru_063319 [Bulinus truncatus]|nr:hypothetical protein Btru_063319 [Bulinus truncatus]